MVIDNNSFESIKGLITILPKLDARFKKKLVNCSKTCHDNTYFFLTLSEKYQMKLIFFLSFVVLCPWDQFYLIIVKLKMEVC